MTRRLLLSIAFFERLFKTPAPSPFPQADTDTIAAQTGVHLGQIYITSSGFLKVRSL